MTLRDIQFIFNRAIVLSFSKVKFFFMFFILALIGVLIVFFRGLAIQMGTWMLMSLTFLSILLSSAILLSVGIVFIRFHHDEVKSHGIYVKRVVMDSLELMISASYFSIPLILSYLVLWMILGLFVLMSYASGIGEFFAVVLSFAPFLVNVGSIVLCLISLLSLFFLTPVIALRGISRSKIAEIVSKRLWSDIFSHVLLLMIGLVPALVSAVVLGIAAALTDRVIAVPSTPVHVVLQWFFVMVPFVALLSPAMVFFFNFAAESHVLLQRKATRSEDLM